MKKGFTLIELLGVIVVLGIILGIGIPTIISLINKSKVKIYNETVNTIENAAKIYVSNKPELLYQLEEEGTWLELTLRQLVEAKLLENTINNPLTDEDFNLERFVVNITKTNDVLTYKFRPIHIKEGLVANYRFDDFQEPTVNLVINPEGSDITNPIPGSYKPGWDVTLHNDALTVTKWASGYNSGVASPSIGYHGKWVYKNTNNTDPVMFFIDENEPFGYPHRWLGISQSMGIASTLGFQTGKAVSVSWSQKAIVLGKGAQVGLYHTLISTGAKSFENNIATININKINKYERVAFTSMVGSNWDLTKDTSIYVYGHYGAHSRLWVDDVQVELKPYATPFTVGIREGIIKDYTNNNHKGILTLLNTPKWIEEGKVGEGAYQFGLTAHNYIVTNITPIYNNITLCAWINPSKYPTDKSTIIQGLNPNGYYLSLTNTGAIATHWYSTTPAGYHVTEANKVPLNKWSFVCTSWDGANNKIYVNDKLLKTTATVGVGAGSVQLNIGAETSARQFFGMIDEVLIYDRALTEDEIRYNFKVEY